MLLYHWVGQIHIVHLSKDKFMPIYLHYTCGAVALLEARWHAMPEVVSSNPGAIHYFLVSGTATPNFSKIHGIVWLYLLLCLLQEHQLITFLNILKSNSMNLTHWPRSLVELGDMLCKMSLFSAQMILIQFLILCRLRSK